MTITPNKQETELAIDSSPISATNQEFNWRNCWYPVSFLQDLPKDKPYRFSLYDEPLVLFKNKDGKLGCIADRCSHRAARLSDGQIIDGKLTGRQNKLFQLFCRPVSVYILVLNYL
ncbi:MAG: Rieske 2Fe-2S domain-containing protein [Pelatocladus maniniholoensis HA4357-MV3]|uniref:Rieske 2Fe-2S domain-containing protein n=1 Tax=Pelatocladus maniniholoensis HA4357-MV3 TaxID=1117104 RepID=A0A9E3HCF2_9NOST|nr:Rieske 2Fe-2S domain-containing protein [Pelatocladus maniniholoensis HA4357-MV3]